jgi:hypothetical protein
LDLLCTAAVVVLVTNLIYCSGGGGKSPSEKKIVRRKKCFAKTPHKGVIRAGNQLVKEDPTASCGCPHAVACPQTALSRRKGHLKKKKKESRSVVFWVNCFFVPCFLFLFFWRPLGGKEGGPAPEKLEGPPVGGGAPPRSFSIFKHKKKGKAPSPKNNEQGAPF